MFIFKQCHHLLCPFWGGGVYDKEILQNLVKFKKAKKLKDCVANPGTSTGTPATVGWWQAVTHHHSSGMLTLC